jgi:hypothetical protein
VVVEMMVELVVEEPMMICMTEFMITNVYTYDKNEGIVNQTWYETSNCRSRYVY